MFKLFECFYRDLVFHLIEISTISLFVQTDRAAMLDEILDYVKFLRLQVKVTMCVNSCQIRNDICIVALSLETFFVS